MTVPKCSAFCSYGRRIIPYLPSVAGERGTVEEKREITRDDENQSNGA